MYTYSTHTKYRWAKEEDYILQTVIITLNIHGNHENA